MFVLADCQTCLIRLFLVALHRNGTTSLQGAFFIGAYYLPVVARYGFSLGLIPIHRLQEPLASSFGKFRYGSHPRTEMVISRPLLWAWAPVGLVLACRLLAFPIGRDRSLLGSTTYCASLYEGSIAPLDLHLTSDLHGWIFDRFVLTGPTLFLVAYSAAVWLRHQFPARLAQDLARNGHF
jgi:hypothetical protein